MSADILESPRAPRMTLTASARLAGFMFLFYIVIGVTNLVLSNKARAGAVGVAARLASIAQHEPLIRLTVLLTLLTFLIAVSLAVALYALTRDQDRDLALIALCCRFAEGMMAAVSAERTMELLSVAKASVASAGADGLAAQTLGAMLLAGGGRVAPICFAVGSTIYCYLFLRARNIPVPLAWLGLLASILLVICLPLQVGGLLRGPVTYFIWIPMALFEVPLGLWLLIKGAGAPRYPSTKEDRRVEPAASLAG